MSKKWYVWKWNKDENGYNTDNGSWHSVSEVQFVTFSGNVPVAVVLDYNDDRMLYCVHPNYVKYKTIKEEE